MRVFKPSFFVHPEGQFERPARGVEVTHRLIGFGQVQEDEDGFPLLLVKRRDEIETRTSSWIDLGNLAP